MLNFIHFRKTALVACVTALCLASCKKEALTPEEPAPAAELSTEALESTKATNAISLAGSNLQLGINGHPLGTTPYINTPATKQIQLLKDMKMTWYRVDVMSKEDGSITVPSLWNPLQQASASGGVNILPMLYTRTLDLTVSEAESYKRGKTLGSNFAAKYGQYFTYYNLGNELEMKCLLPTKSGQSQADYNKAKYNVIRGYLRGMDEGIKAKDPGAKTMIDGSWLHYGFLRMLDWDGVKFDVVAWHWYSEMEGAAAGSMYKIPDITQKLSSLFPKKDIWFTEVNSRYKDASTHESKQNTFIVNFIEKCKKNPKVKVLMIYELFNEPFKKGLLEPNYGIYKWTVEYTSYTKKMVAKTLSAK
ncbi:hypothetical protein EOD41_00575 [Mucilaginibacter limnophilus]|uniref:Asl1-like glycosyl hydrolase catalytic domain-containing protein n=1 Tax=Mucilaginibacter limnophilus TaxID=1932778 RepID=A0A437MXT4_9SPHI|nr:glycosyl hydrolase [Mucilaginibacter limnophilus]RVU02468.1 hypothetical protein EOD41_00575 [Mucilaginibacter limnophilus]